MKEKWHMAKHAGNSVDLLRKSLPHLRLGHITDAYLATLRYAQIYPSGKIQICVSR